MVPMDSTVPDLKTLERAVCGREQTKKFHVYVDLTTEDVPRAFYVGKGSKSRVKLLERRGNKLHANILNTYGIQRVVIYETDDEQDAFETEVEAIKTLQTRSHRLNGHWGANHTDGGEGVVGRKHTDESRAKLFGNKNASGKRSIAQRKKMSSVLRGPIPLCMKRLLSKSLSTHTINVDGQLLTWREVSERFNLTYIAVRNRVYRGWSEEEICLTPQGEKRGI
jgi:hypothetical protein